MHLKSRGPAPGQEKTVAAFADLTARALRMAGQVPVAYVRLLRLLSSCCPASEASLLRREQERRSRANDWRYRQIERILRWDPRLAQPRYITGYLGARIAKWYVAAKEVRPIRSHRDFLFVKERRCRNTGGQLCSGDVLRLLYIEPHNYTNAYEVLRRVSADVGIDYVDGAGRHHKLYTWGDVPDLAQRLRDGSWVLREARRSHAYVVMEECNALPHEVEEEDFEDIPF